MRIRNESLAGGEDKKTNPISSLFHEASFLPSPVRPFVRSEDHGSLTDGSQTGYNGVKFIRLHIGAIKRQAGGARSRGRGTKEGLILNIIYLGRLKSEGGKRAPSPSGGLISYVRRGGYFSEDFPFWLIKKSPSSFLFSPQF